MPIIKRKTPSERLSLMIGPNWQEILRHPAIASLTNLRMSYDRYDASSLNISRAINEVSAWRGASWQDKVFVLTFASLAWRAFGAEVLTDANYNRLYKHLHDNELDIANSCHLVYHQTLLWDLSRLKMFNKDTLRLAPPPKVKPPVKKRTIRKKRRK